MVIQLETLGLSKCFGATQALEDVSLRVVGGQVLALLGENGAGKSTLIKVLAGIHRPDAGSIRLNGQPVLFRSPMQALHAGVVLVPQELRVVPGLSVAENVLLGQLPTRRVASFLPAVDRAALRSRASAILREIQVDLDVDALAGELDFASRQLVVIARALGHRAQVLILDEPTASLEQREVERLFAVVRRLRDQGVAVIYISHRLEEIAELADACVVMRDGRIAARIDAPPFAPETLIRAMTGRDMKPGGGATMRERGELRIELPLDGGGSLKCHRGEVVGLGGLLGSGTATLLHKIFGSHEEGHRRESAVKAAITGGTGLVPGERARALVMPMSIRDNIVLPHLDAFTHAFGRDEKRIDNAVAQLMDLLDIRPRVPELPVRNLSGGNQQKVAFAKWLVGKLELLLLDEPTNGIDIAAKALIHQRIAAFAGAGGTVIVSSSDMPELLDLSDAVVVLRRGRLTGHMERAGDFGEPRLRTLLGIGL